LEIEIIKKKWSKKTKWQRKSRWPPSINFLSYVNLNANQLKLWISIERSIKKNVADFFFSILQNGGLTEDEKNSHTAISQPNSTYKPILNLL
jgi:hypothetical protein